MSATVAVESGRHRLDREQLGADPFGFRAQVGFGQVAELRTDDAAEVAAALVNLDRWAGEVHLLPDGVDIVTGGVRLELVAAPTRPTATPGPAPATRWVLYTSGTTGAPKAITHTLGSLRRTVSSSAPPMHWGLTYDPNRMAGLQVILQSLATGSTLVAPAVTTPLTARIDRFVAGGVEAISATPTVWRRILQVPGSAALQLRQITLGGEIADQPVLDALRARFPDARIVHVFASTETGAAFSVTDGRAGFPASYLTEAPRGVQLQIRDGILHVHSPGVSVAGPDGFASTGDVVEIVDDRVMFRGRASGVVNVGGANVWPESVENVLRTHPAVADAVVTAKSNALSGNVLIATVVPVAGVESARLGKELRGFVREHAPASHVPAMVKLVDALDVAPTGKLVR